MIEIIKYKSLVYAIIIRKRFKLKKNSIKFFTNSNFSQQLGYMHRPKNYKISPHTHKKNLRRVFYTQEVLFMRKGKVKVNFYNLSKIFFTSKIIQTGDTILLAHGGHGFDFIKQSELIEIKQGPFIKKKDKIIF
jgi:hypothetical protein